MSQRGAYTADRAAGLSGVPKSTIHYWARKGILVPSISPDRVKLWSYSDLMGLRTISWLRRDKGGAGHDVPASSMRAVRRALETLADLDMKLWTEDSGPSVCVDGGGHVFLNTVDGPRTSDGQAFLDGTLDLIEPFTVAGASGPDLHRPRPSLRIVPGKLSGAPHILGTRIETEAIAAIARRNFTHGEIAALYPEIQIEAVAEAVDLESQMSGRTLSQAA